MNGRREPHHGSGRRYNPKGVAYWRRRHRPSTKEPAFAAQPPDRTDEFIQKASATAREFARVFKLLEGDPENASLKAQVARLRTELEHVQHELSEEDPKGAEFLKSEFGVDDAWLREFERAEIPTFGNDFFPRTSSAPPRRFDWKMPWPTATGA
jgi:hypothetical protein